MPFDSSFLGGGGVSGVQDNITKIQANRKARWDMDQQQGLADAFAQSLVTAPIPGSQLKPGDLDEAKFYTMAQQKGLSPELAAGYRNWFLANKQAQTTAAGQNVNQRMLGFGPDAAKPSNELQQQDRFLNPQAGDTAQGQEPAASPLQAPSANDFFQRVSGRANPTSTQQRAPAKARSEQSAAPTTQGGQSMDLGSANLATFKTPPPTEEPAKAPDNYGVIQGFMATDSGFNPMQMLKSAGFTPRTSGDVKKMSEADRRETAAGLRAKGIPVPDKFDFATLADAMNRYAADNVRAKMGAFNPFSMEDTMKAAMGATTGAEATANEAIGDLAKGARETKTTRLGQTSAAQGIQSTGQELAAVADARKQGFGNVTRTNIGNFKETKSAVDWLGSTKGETDHMLAQARAGKPLDADEFGTLLIGLTQAPKNAEGIGTEAGQADFMATLRREKSLGQVVGEARGIKDLAELAAKNAIAPQGQAVILRNLSNLLGVQLKTGKAVNELKQYRTAGQNAKETIEERARGAAGALPKFSSPSDPGFAALPSGAYFLDGSGKRRQKK